MGLNMADANVPLADALRCGNAEAFAGEFNFGLPAGFGADFDVRPGDAAAPARTENFQHRFLGSESAGQMLKSSLHAFRTILLFKRRKDPVEEMRAMLLDHVADSTRLNNINSVSDDGHVEAR